MKCANSGPRVTSSPNYPQVSQLSVTAAEHRSATDDQANPDTRAYGYIREFPKALRGTPTLFCQCGAVHVGVETHCGHAAVREAP